MRGEGVVPDVHDAYRFPGSHSAMRGEGAVPDVYDGYRFPGPFPATPGKGATRPYDAPSRFAPRKGRHDAPTPLAPRKRGEGWG